MSKAKLWAPVTREGTCPPAERHPGKQGVRTEREGRHPDMGQLRICNLRTGGLQATLCPLPASHLFLTYFPLECDILLTTQNVFRLGPPEIHTSLNKYLNFEKAERRDESREGEKKKQIPAPSRSRKKPVVICYFGYVCRGAFPRKKKKGKRKGLFNTWIVP